MPPSLPQLAPLSCYDGWDHIDAFGTQVAMVLQYPESGLRQGVDDRQLGDSVAVVVTDAASVAHRAVARSPVKGCCLRPSGGRSHG